MGRIIKNFLGNGKKDSYPKKNFEPLRPAVESEENFEVKPFEKPNTVTPKGAQPVTPNTVTPKGAQPATPNTVTPKIMPPLAPNAAQDGQYDYGLDPYGYYSGNIPPKITPKVPAQKPLVNAKLTIFLVENTKDVVRLGEELTKAISAGNSEYVCVINYGLIVRKGEVIKASKFDNNAIFYKKLIEEDACFYDAIEALGEVVQEYFQKIEEIFGKRIKINSIDIIGIGRGIDNSSIVSREEAKKIISKISKYKGVTTKYCCLREEHFIQTAAMGFRSIVSIDRNYM